MAELLDVETIGVIVGIVFATAVMMWVLARISRYFEYLKMQEHPWLDRDTLSFIHRVLEWIWIGMMLLFILFLAQLRSPEIRELLFQANLRMPAILFVVFVLFTAAVAARVVRRFGAYLRGELPVKPKTLAPPRALALAEAIIRLLVWVAAAFFAYVGGVALLPAGDQDAIDQVLPRPAAPDATTVLTFAFAALGIYVALRIVDSVFDDVVRRRARESPAVAEGFRSLLKIVIYVVAVFLLAFLALDLALDPARLASLGVFLVAFALLLLVVVLAARDLVGGAFAGVSLLLADTYHVRDRIRLEDGRTLEVTGMTLTTTQGRDDRGETVVLPNAALVRQRIANLTRTPAAVLSMSVRVPVDVPHARVESLLREASTGIDGLKPEVRVFLRDLSEGLIRYEVIGTVNEAWKRPDAESALLARTQELFAAQGVPLR